MSTRVGFEQVALMDLILAVVLLVGVSLVGYGYFHPSTNSLFSGLFTIR